MNHWRHFCDVWSCILVTWIGWEGHVLTLWACCLRLLGTRWESATDPTNHWELYARLFIPVAASVHYFHLTEFLWKLRSHLIFQMEPGMSSSFGLVELLALCAPANQSAPAALLLHRFEYWASLHHLIEFMQLRLYVILKRFRLQLGCVFNHIPVSKFMIIVRQGLT